MTKAEKTNNEKLRELVEASGLTQAVALTVFNRGLGVGGYSESAWKSWLCHPDSTRFRPLKDELLQHAQTQFARIKESS